MVASAVDINTRHKIYGYMLSLEGSKPSILPSRFKSSSDPYIVQIAYVPGAILRKSALKDTLRFKDPLTDSIRLSLDLWLSGHMIQLNPESSYISQSERIIDVPFHIAHLPEGVDKLAVKWRKALVG
jgi:hypothetical protein